MTCLEAQENMMKFVKNQLNIELAKEFIDHVRTCPDCREELEVTHVLSSALWQLDNDVDFNGDYSAELTNHINQVEAKIRKYQTRKTVNRFILPIILLIILFLTGFYKPNENMQGYQYDFLYSVPEYALEYIPVSDKGLEYQTVIRYLVHERDKGTAINIKPLKDIINKRKTMEQTEYGR